MKKIITTLYAGLSIALLVFVAGSAVDASAQTQSPVKPIYCNNVSYFLKIDTAGTNVGYLRVGSSGVHLNVGSQKDEYAMWLIDSIPSPTTPTYVFINKKTTDTLRFSIPSSPDTLAIINKTGGVRYWKMKNPQFEEGRPETFSWSDGTRTFNLTLGEGGTVMLSSPEGVYKDSLSFMPERVLELPKADKFYRLKVDTLGMRDTALFLCADTLVRRDSLSVVDTTGFGDLSLWKFVADTIVNDTTYFSIRNKGTNRPLAFDTLKTSVSDTIAEINDAGVLKQWLIPFFAEDTLGFFMARDTSKKRDYYVGLDDTIVRLLDRASAYARLRFVVEEDGYTPPVLDSSIVDTTQVYKVKYVNGPHAGKYLADILGDTVYLDSVYAHIPDGQFVVDKNNRYRLISRATGRIFTSAASDSLQKVVVGGVVAPNQYANKIDVRDTFEIVPITYGNIASYKARTHLGYKYLSPEELNGYLFSLSRVSSDSLNGLFMNYNRADSSLRLAGTDESAHFFMKVSNSITVAPGAPSIGGIPALQQSIYELRSYDDTTLYISTDPLTSQLKLSRTPAKIPFYLKEGNQEGLYYLVTNVGENNTSIAVKKALVDSTWRFNMANIDSTATHLFAIKGNLAGEVDTPDPYTYLTELPHGAGFYELTSTIFGASKMITKNFYNYTVWGAEGESVLKSGSYTKYDLRMWVDTARGQSYNPVRPSFYIVKEEKLEGDTILADNFASLQGYFLHVMDSAATGNDAIDNANSVLVVGNRYKRLNFVRAKRHTSNELLLMDTGGATATLRDSVGFAGKNEQAINEYRFYFQETDEPNKYYIVTELGYGGAPRARGYLSSSNGVAYVGPRDNNDVCKVSLDNYVANEIVVAPPVVSPPQEVARQIRIVGGNGSISILNAAGERATLYNIVGQQLANKQISSDNEKITAPRGIVIVKIGRTKTQKVVVK